MNRKITITIIIAFFLFSISCAVDEKAEQSVLNSYRTLTAIPVTPELIVQIIANLKLPELNDTQILQLILYPVKVYKITYRTTYKGNEIIASGAVSVPDTPGKFPVVNYHHGTIFRDSRAPSNYRGGLDMEAETALGMIIASSGFICSSPDLIGYGDSTDQLHPYHLSVPTAASSLDMLRAVGELLDSLGYDPPGSYYLSGYSEGAYAAMSLQREIEQYHSNEFPLTASSLGAGAYYLSGTIAGMIGYTTLASPAYIAFIISAYNEYYGWGRDLSAVFQSPYSDRLAAGILYGDLTQGEINNLLTGNVFRLFTGQFLSDFRGAAEEQLKAAFIENDLINGWMPRVPTRLYHGTWDDVVPKFNSEIATNSFNLAGSSSVQFIPLYKKDHETAIIPWIKSTILWFDSFRQ
jgi:pimeloyl-ACP methyl ester carboxylesterase